MSEKSSKWIVIEVVFKVYDVSDVRTNYPKLSKIQMITLSSNEAKAGVSVFLQSHLTLLADVR